MHVAHYENLEKTALEANNSPKIIRETYLDIVTREEAERFWNIRPLVNTPTKGTKNFGMSKPIKSKKTETTSPIAKKSRPVEAAKMIVNGKVHVPITATYPLEEFKAAIAGRKNTLERHQKRR